MTHNVFARKSGSLAGDTSYMKLRTIQGRSDNRNIIDILNTILANGLCCAQCVQDTLGETQIFDGARELAVFYQKCPIAGSAAKDSPQRMQRIRMLETRHINTMIDLPDHFLQAMLASFHHRMQRHRAKTIRGR